MLQEALLHADAEMVYKSMKPSPDSTEAASSQHQASDADEQADTNPSADTSQMQAAGVDMQAESSEGVCPQVHASQDVAMDLCQPAAIEQLAADI